MSERSSLRDSDPLRSASRSANGSWRVAGRPRFWPPALLTSERSVFGESARPVPELALCSDTPFAEKSASLYGSFSWCLRSSLDHLESGTPDLLLLTGSAAPALAANASAIAAASRLL